MSKNVRMESGSRVRRSMQSPGEVGTARFAHRAMSAVGGGAQLLQRLGCHREGVVPPQCHRVGG
eukprot:4979312-Amphidinium_carterae.1